MTAFSSDFAYKSNIPALHNEFEVLSSLTAPQFIHSDASSDFDIRGFRFQGIFRDRKLILFEVKQGHHEFGTAIIVYGSSINMAEIEAAANSVHATVKVSKEPKKLNENSFLIELNTVASPNNIMNMYGSINFTQIRYDFLNLNRKDAHQKLLQYMSAVSLVFENTKLPVIKEPESDMPFFKVLDEQGKDLLSVTLDIGSKNKIYVHLASLNYDASIDADNIIKYFRNRVIALQPYDTIYGQLDQGCTYVRLKADKDIVYPELPKSYLQTGSLPWCQKLLSALRKNPDFSELVISGFTIPNQPDTAVDLYRFLSTAKIY